MMRETLTVGCFFLISVSYKLAWTAISSLLSQFSAQHGPEILLQLNVAYFLPSIPILILQTMLNESMDRRMGIFTATLTRFSLGLGGLVALTHNFPSLAAISQTGLLATTAMIGVCYGIAFGTSYQLASKFSPACTVALTTGFVSSGPVVLALDLLLKSGAFYTEGELVRLFTAVARLTFCGLCAACVMVMFNRRHLLVLQQMNGGVTVRLDSKLHLSSSTLLGRGKTDGEHKYLVARKGTNTPTHAESNGSHAFLLDTMEGGGHSSLSDGGDLHRSSLGSRPDDNDKMKRDMRPFLLAWRISPAMFAMFLSVGTSMIVFPFFTFMHSTGLLHERLPQVLFYVRLIGDILGRVVPTRLQATTIRSLMFWSFVKLAMVPLIFLSIFSPELTFGDLGAILYVGVFWMLSGYVNTCAYLMAPKLVSPSQKPRASGMMTVAFQSSCFIALIVAAVIQRATLGEHEAIQ